MHSKHLGKKSGKNSRGGTRTNSGEPLRPKPRLVDELCLLWSTHTTLLTPACLCTPPAPVAPPLPPPTAGDLLGLQSAAGGEETRRREGEGEKKERKKEGTWGRKREKLHFSPFLSTNHNQAPNFLQPSPYFLTTTPNNTKEPETKPPKTHKHQHTTGK